MSHKNEIGFFLMVAGISAALGVLAPIPWWLWITIGLMGWAIRLEAR